MAAIIRWFNQRGRILSQIHPDDPFRRLTNGDERTLLRFHAHRKQCIHGNSPAHAKRTRCNRRVEASFICLWSVFLKPSNLKRLFVLFNVAFQLLHFTAFHKMTFYTFLSPVKRKVKS